MKNVIVCIFSDEAKTYESLSNMKNWTGSSKVLSGAAIKNTGEGILIKDGFDFDNDGSGWLSGSLIGGLVGLIAGPIGILLGGSIGALIGLGSDETKINDSENVINQVISKLDKYKLALILIVDEPNTLELNNYFANNDCSELYRYSFEQVELEVSKAKKLQKELAKKTKKEMK